MVRKTDSQATSVVEKTRRETEDLSVTRSRYSFSFFFTNFFIKNYKIVEGLMRAITRCWRCAVTNRIYSV